MYKSVKKIMLIIYILISLTSCVSINTINPRNNKITIALPGEVISLNPMLHNDRMSSLVNYQIFDTLLKRNSDRHMAPSIAKSWKMIKDQLWTFKIRDDVLFHNGDKLTIQDVKFSIDSVLNNKNSPLYLAIKVIKSVQIDDENILIIETEKPYPVLLSHLCDLRIIPKKYIEEKGVEYFTSNPVGSGPYKLLSNNNGVVSLTFNENYWRGTPDVKNVNFKPIISDNKRYDELLNSNIDIIIDFPQNKIKQAKDIDKIKIYNITSPNMIYICINTQKSLVKDIRVRRAINYAINREDILNDILHQHGYISNQIINKFDLGYNDELIDYDYNPKRSLELLSELKLRDKELILKCPVGTGSTVQKIAAIIKEQLEEIGLHIKVKFDQYLTYYNNVLEGKDNSDLLLIEWSNNTLDAGYTLETWAHTCSKTSYYYVSQETNSHINNLIDEALSTMEEIKREQIYDDIIQQVHNDSAFISLLSKNNIYGVSSNINIVTRKDNIIEVFDIKFN